MRRLMHQAEHRLRAALRWRLRALARFMRSAPYAARLQLRLRAARRHDTGIQLSPSSRQLVVKWDALQAGYIRKARHHGLRVATARELVHWKKSDTLVVLGSGPSINDLDSKDWAFVSECDSIGFNYFLLHPFVPTFCHVEYGAFNETLFPECYQSAAPALRQRPLLLNALHLSATGWENAARKFENVLLSVPRRYHEATPDQLAELLRYHCLARSPVRDGFLLHYRASLSIMLSLAVLMGYRRILLAGIDLTSNRFFFSDRDRYSAPAAEAVRSAMENALLRVRRSESDRNTTVDTGLWDELPIDQFVQVFRRDVLTPLGIELGLLTVGSLLSSFLPEYQVPRNVRQRGSVSQ